MPDRSPGHHLAQVNIGRLRAPLDSPLLADFVAALDPVNALADASPGFVWRLQDDNGNATSLRVFGDDQIIINLSVWDSIETLREFTYRSQHLAVLARRREWFEKMHQDHQALWWLPAGDLPTIEDAKGRLDLLRRLGPGPDAFTFRQPFPPPTVAAVVGGVVDADGLSGGRAATAVRPGDQPPA